MIHYAIVHLAEPSPEGETEQVFASVDGGDHYLPINRIPEAGDEERIAALFEGDRTKPMTWARRALKSDWWPEGMVTEVTHHEV